MSDVFNEWFILCTQARSSGPLLFHNKVIWKRKLNKYFTSRAIIIFLEKNPAKVDFTIWRQKKYPSPFRLPHSKIKDGGSLIAPWYKNEGGVMTVKKPKSVKRESSSNIWQDRVHPEKAGQQCVKHHGLKLCSLHLSPTAKEITSLTSVDQWTPLSNKRQM